MTHQVPEEYNSLTTPQTGCRKTVRKLLNNYSLMVTFETAETIRFDFKFQIMVQYPITFERKQILFAQH